MKALAYICAITFFLISRSGAAAQGAAYEDAASPRLSDALSQDDAPASLGLPGYGSVDVSIKPLDLSADSAAPFSGSGQMNQTPMPPPPATPVSSTTIYWSRNPSMAASSWSAGSTAMIGGRTTNPAFTSSQPNQPASQFVNASFVHAGMRGSSSSYVPMSTSVQAGGLSRSFVQPTMQASPSSNIPISIPGQSEGLPSSFGNISMSGGLNSQLNTSFVLRPRAMPNEGPTATLLKQTGNFVPGVSIGSQTQTPLDATSSPSPTQGIRGGNSNTASPGSPENLAENDATNNQHTTLVSNFPPGSFAQGSLAAARIASPTSEGMTIRLIPTADGLQLVLQTKNSLSGSILFDQSTVSRSDAGAPGWWNWGAGAGSWAPINTLTTSSPSRFEDPAEKLLEKITPGPKLDKNLASPEESQSRD